MQLAIGQVRMFLLADRCPQNEACDQPAQSDLIASHGSEEGFMLAVRWWPLCCPVLPKPLPVHVLMLLRMDVSNLRSNEFHIFHMCPAGLHLACGLQGGRHRPRIWSCTSAPEGWQQGGRGVASRNGRLGQGALSAFSMMLTLPRETPTSL